MQVTFLIGNGFDINCGLKCTYKDVYAGYCKTTGQSDVIAKFKEEINGNIDTWADFEMAMNAYLPSFKCEADFLSCARDFKVYMIAHLQKEENEFSKTFLSSNSPYEYEIKAETRESLSSFYQGISHNLSQQFNGVEGEQFINCRFIVFNYTNIADRILRPFISTSHIIHVHGLLNDDPVLGIDNKQQLLGEISFPYTNRLLREFVKPYFNQEYDARRVRTAKEWINNSDVICVFGMSLGDSDLSWRNQLLEWLQKDGHHLFLYSYKYSRMILPTVTARLDQEDDAKESFFNAMKLSKQVATIIEPKIHIPIGKNLFNIDEANKRTLIRIIQDKEAREKARKQSVGKLGNTAG